MSTVDAARRLLGPHDPAPHDPGAPLDAEAEQTLHQLLSTAGTVPPAHRASAGRPRRRPLALVAAAAVVVGVVGVGTGALPVPGSGGPAAQAATPDPLLLPPGAGRPGRGQLLRLAERAQAHGPAGTEAAPYRYSRTRSWYLHSTVTRTSVTSQLQEEVRESWLAADGSGTVATTRAGQTRREARPPSETPVPPARQVLSDDPEVLAQQLLGYPYQPGRDNEGVPDAMERLDAVRGLASAGEPLGPDLTAALLRVLADQGLTSYGRVTDRAGRDGLVFTRDSDHAGLPTRHLLVLDPATGQVLGYEEVLTQTASSLDVRVPAVLSYEVFLEQGPAAGAPPAGTS